MTVYKDKIIVNRDFKFKQIFEVATVNEENKPTTWGARDFYFLSDNNTKIKTTIKSTYVHRVSASTNWIVDDAVFEYMSNYISKIIGILKTAEETNCPKTRMSAPAEGDYFYDVYGNLCILEKLPPATSRGMLVTAKRVLNKHLGLWGGGSKPAEVYYYTNRYYSKYLTTLSLVLVDNLSNLSKAYYYNTHIVK